MKYLKTFEGFSEKNDKHFTYAFKVWFDTKRSIKDKVLKSYIKDRDNLNYRIEKTIEEMGDNITLYFENHPCIKNLNIKGKDGEEYQDIFGTFELNNTICDNNDIVYYINDSIEENEKLDNTIGDMLISSLKKYYIKIQKKLLL